ncbi:MAG: hypothetical protein PHZ00_05105 [Candidatus Peribacteraceae bacterium]|nr:hypothetical protein [Candidatus Peribacteraceae bacterium]
MIELPQLTAALTAYNSRTIQGKVLRSVIDHLLKTRQLITRVGAADLHSLESLYGLNCTPQQIRLPAKLAQDIIDVANFTTYDISGLFGISIADLRGSELIELPTAIPKLSYDGETQFDVMEAHNSLLMGPNRTKSFFDRTKR